MSIKYYQLAKDEELPDEFCAVRDVGGEPSEYTFYVPEDENAKLRELVRDMYAVMVEDAANCDVTYPEQFDDRMRELGVEVE